MSEPHGDGACLEVLDPGLLATVQDLGRPGLGALGITPGGAADRASLAVANALLGNPAGAAAIELAFPGAVLVALRPVTVAVAGADLGAVVRATGLPVPPGRSVTLRAGESLAFEGGNDPRVVGCRAYLALPGGVEVPVVLGSRATALGAGFGGLGGRALRAGDRLTAGDPAPLRVPEHWTGPVTVPSAGPLRILPGPHAAVAGRGVADLAAALAARRWTVSPASDRIGLRLGGERLPAGTGDLASLGVLAGAVQLPPDGLPIVLLADHQPTGGYPVIAVVASVDRPRLGQVAPGAEVTFQRIDETTARRLALGRRVEMRAALEHLREAVAWDALWRGAGG